MLPFRKSFYNQDEQTSATYIIHCLDLSLTSKLDTHKYTTIYLSDSKDHTDYPESCLGQTACNSISIEQVTQFLNNNILDSHSLFTQSTFNCIKLIHFYTSWNHSRYSRCLYSTLFSFAAEPLFQKINMSNNSSLFVHHNGYMHHSHFTHSYKYHQDHHDQHYTYHTSLVDKYIDILIWLH